MSNHTFRYFFIECIWKLEFGWNGQIVVKFLDINIDDHRNNEGCDRDFVLIRNGRASDSPILGKYCGNNLPPSIISMGPYLWIEFHSDENSNGNGRGFSLSAERHTKGTMGHVT